MQRVRESYETSFFWRNADLCKECFNLGGVVTTGREKAVDSNAKREVVVTDIKMPFGSMVVFMIKWALASIPAFIILAVIWAIAIGVFGGIFGAMGRR